MNGENVAGGIATTGPRAKCDQVIFEALAKATEIIVASRGGGNNHGQPLQSSPSSSSARFNLMLPENPSLRNILQRWRRALHLPVRLDVYYEHADQRRELLERWCLGYVMGDAFWRDQHNAALHSSTDPIVQLRHVCKKIVIWLRTLYCFARMLPSTGFLHAQSSNVGFSLYAVSEDMDDVSQLKEQGFLYQGQPSAAVTTPYGELSWQVLYAPGNTVQRLIPRASNKAGGTLLQPTRTSQAIPILGANREPAHRADHFEKGDTLAKRRMQQGGIPQTAPAHMNQYLMNEMGLTTEQRDDHRTAAAALPQQNTFNPSFFTANRDRHSSADDTRQHPQQQPWPQQPHGLLQRRHTSIGQETDDQQHPQYQHYPTRNKSMVAQEKPARVLSGLSLALLMSDNKNGDPDQQGPQNHHVSDQTNDAAAEKRRAALHQMPPHLQPQPQNTRSSSNEYGYAYNNHIPRQKSTLDIPHPPVPRELSSSPSLFGTTPPSGGMLGGGFPDMNASPPPPTISLTNLLPPRNNMPATPPFAPRPAGFVQDHYPLPPPAQQQPPPPPPRKPHTAEPSLTSLDMLHHSPFHHGAQQHHGGSMISSLSGGVFGSEAASLFYNSADLRKSGLVIAQASEEYEEMPFAVDNLPEDGSSASHIFLASSAAVASFAQKCSVHQRLELFDRQQQQQQQGIRIAEQAPGEDHDEVDDLADQLADFRSFGASLRLSTTLGPTTGAEVNTSSTSTPIPLRT